MKRIALLCTLAAFALALAPPAHAQKTARDGVFIHLSHGPKDPHRVLMALTMATRMATDKDVLVYLDIEAIHLVVKDAETVEMEGFEPSNVLLKKLLDAKVTVMACPTCLAVAGKTASDLMEGIRAAEKEAFFSFTKGRILTLDY